MDLGPYFSRIRDFFKQLLQRFRECDHLECQVHDSPFSPNYSCHSNHDSLLTEDGVETSQHQGYCHRYKDSCLPVIFDRRYDFADRELCSRHFSIRLGGLRNKMAAELRRYIGCRVVIGYENDNNVKKIKGRISFVGTDFVEISSFKKRKCKDQSSLPEFTLIPFNKINWLEREDNA